MNWLLLFEGMLIGLLLFSSLFSFSLWLKGIDKALNLSYGFFSFFGAIGFLHTTKNFFVTDITTLLFNYKIFSYSILLALLASIFVIAALTDYWNRKLIWTICIAIVIVLIFQIALPYGVVFKKIIGIKTEVTLWGDKYNLPNAEISKGIWFAFLIITLVFTYIFLGTKHLYKSGERKLSKIILAAFIIGFLGQTLDIVLLAFNIRTFAIIDDFAFFSFGILVGYKNYLSIIKTREIRHELIDSEFKYRMLAENVVDLIWTTDLDLNFTYVSNSVINLQGWKPDEMLLKNAREVISEESFEFIVKMKKEALNDLKENSLNNEKSFNFVSRLKRKDNSEFWADITAKPLFNQSGNIIGILGITRDIDEKIKVEEKLYETKNILETSLSQSPSGITIIDAKTLDIKYINNSALQIRGMCLDDLGKDNYKQHHQTVKTFKKNSIDEYLPEELPLYKAVKFGIVTLNEEMIVQRSDGTMHWISATANPIKDEDGEIIVGIAVFNDITERKKVEQLIIQSEKMTSIAGLAAGMAHEINNPLGTIVQGCQNIIRRTSKKIPKNDQVAIKYKFSIDQIESYLEEREVFRIIDSIKSAAEKSSQIIKNMLQFSRGSNEKRFYNLSKLIDDCIDLAYNDYNMKKKYDLRSFSIIKKIEPVLPEIKIIATEIEQVIFNLIRNSVQALKDFQQNNIVPTIKISCFQNEDEIEIDIEDNGPGIPKEIHNRIFEPFFTTKEVGEGTGLGLSVSYMIINSNHNGVISVESSLESGTKFIIKLPING